MLLRKGERERGKEGGRSEGGGVDVADDDDDSWSKGKGKLLLLLLLLLCTQLCSTNNCDFNPSVSGMFTDHEEVELHRW